MKDSESPEDAIVDDNILNEPDDKTNQAETKQSDDKTKKAEKKDTEALNRDKNKFDKEDQKAEWIEKTIDFDIHSERERAINEILTIKDENLKKKLETKLVNIIETETNIDVKNKAINVVGELKTKDAVTILTKCLNDESMDIRISAVYAIGKINDISAKPTLIEKFKEQDFAKNSNYTVAIIDTLGDMKTTDVQKEAVAIIIDNTTTKNNREQLVIFLGKIGSKDSKDALVNLLSDEAEDAGIRSLAANSLAKLQIKESAAVINDTVKKIESLPFKKRTQYYKLYIYCIGALARLGDESAIPRLIDSARSNNTSVRLFAIKLMKEIKDKRTIDILKHKAKYDTSMKVQKAASEAVTAIEDEIKKQQSQAAANAATADKAAKPEEKKENAPGNKSEAAPPDKIVKQDEAVKTLSDKKAEIRQTDKVKQDEAAKTMPEVKK
ncbi:MAG: HEAT repeat domain-containing protein [Spirochaetes bacterium]|nr:HEAT repeat domain-containing protein [Spirochaetota bacterium]